MVLMSKLQHCCQEIMLEKRETSVTSKQSFMVQFHLIAM